MKYYYALPPALIGVSIVLVSQTATALSAPEVEKIGREITVQIVDSQNPTVTGSGVIIKQTGNTYTVITAYHVVRTGKQYKMLAVGVDVGVRPPSVVAAAPKADDFNIRGNEKYNRKDYKGAIADYTEAIRLNPNYADAYYNRGIARSGLGDKQAAIADYNSALKINPNLAQAYYNRGVVRYDLGDKQAAIADYNSAIKINPNAADAYYNRGITRYALGDKQGGIADWQKAAQLYRQQGKTADYQDALELIRKYQQ